MNNQSAFYNGPHPVGTMEITMEGKKVLSIQFLKKYTSSTPITSLDPSMKFFFDELDQYFKKDLKTFQTQVSLHGSEFEIKVWQELLKIPYANIRSYKDIAKGIGDINGVRAVGGANGRNKIPILIPCHRVIGNNGSLTGYSGGLEIKSWLLHHEGAIAEQLQVF